MTTTQEALADLLIDTGKLTMASWLGSGKIIDSKNNIYNVSENGEIDPIIPKGTILSGYAFKWNLPKANGKVVIGIQ
jgi:hypothetical protein